MASTYTHNQFNGLMEQAKDPTIENLTSAADYVKVLFQANKIHYGFLGGYSPVL